MASGVFSLVTFLGPAIGPMTGSWIAEKTEWRWVFWATSIFDSILLILTFFCLGESTYLYSTVRKFINHLWL